MERLAHSNELPTSEELFGGGLDPLLSTPLETTAPKGTPKTLLGKRVLLIAPQPFFANRGTPINVRAIAEAVCLAGGEVDILAYPFGESVAISGVKIYRSKGLPLVRSVGIGPSWQKVALDSTLCLSALRLALTKRYDLFHGIEEGAFVAGFLARLKRRPFIFDLDSNMGDQLRLSGFLAGSPLVSLFTSMERYFLRRATGILTVCRSLTEFAERERVQGQILQLEDFPIESTHQIDESLLRQVRSELPGKRIVYTGNLEYYQGVELLLRSFAAVRLSDQGFEASLLIIGGKSGDVQRLRALAKELQVDEWVRLTGERPGSEMGSYLAAADVLVSPRLRGSNTPLKIYSYMASGVPIVATEIESHTQVLSDQEAILVSPDIEGMSEGLRVALKGEGRERASNARRLIDERYNQARFNREIERFYCSILRRSI